MKAENLISLLEEGFYSFDVLQLVNVINEVLEGGNNGSDGGNGNSGGIFFEADPSLAFPPGDVGFVEISGCGNNCHNGNDNSGGNNCHGDSYHCNNNDNVCVRQATVRLPVMNLLGSSSPLPMKFSDYIARGKPDAGMYRDFLSMMQNRVHTLWIDAHRKYALWNNGGSVAKSIFQSMSALTAEQVRFFDGALARFGAFARGARSASGLKELLRSIWKDIPVRVEENVGRWTSVDNARPIGGGFRLGRCAAGTKVFDRTSKFRVSLGPLDYGTYKTFLPGEGNRQFLQKILSLYLNEPLICELEISCRQSDLAPARTGGEPEGRLGRTTALGRPAEDGRVHRYSRSI